MRKLILAGLAVLLLVPVVGSQTKHLNAPTPESDLGHERPWRDLNVSRNIVAGAAATIGGNATVAGTLAVTGTLTATVTDWNTTSAKGAIFQPFVNEEEIDLGGADELAAVQSSADLIPADSIIFGITKRVTEAFAGDVANYDLGDESTSDRFVTNSTDLTLADTGVHNEDGVLFDTADSKIEVLLDDAATAGKLRVTVFGVTLSAATS